MISEFEQKIIEELDSREDLEYFVKIAENSENPFFLRALATSYNWNDGFSIPIAIANNRYCDLGIALTLFWLAEGIALYTSEIVPNEHNQEWAEYSQLLIDRLIADHYQIGIIGFKPSISKLTEHKYNKRNVPSVLFSEVVGA